MLGDNVRDCGRYSGAVHHPCMLWTIIGRSVCDCIRCHKRLEAVDHYCSIITVYHRILVEILFFSHLYKLSLFLSSFLGSFLLGSGIEPWNEDGELSSSVPVLLHHWEF